MFYELCDIKMKIMAVDLFIRFYAQAEPFHDTSSQKVRTK